MFSLKKGVIYLFFTKVLVAFTGLITVIITSRYLGADGRGIISLFMSSVALLQLFCDFGSSSVIINLSYRINQRRLWCSAIIWVSGICLLSLIPAWFFRHIPFIFLVPPAAFLFSFLNINTLLLMGNLMVNRRNTLLILQPVMVLLFFVLAYFFLDMQVSSYPIAFLAALLISLLISYFFIRSKLHEHGLKDSAPFVFEKELLSKGFWVQSGHAIQFLNYRINFFLIIFFIGNAALGVYNNAIVIAESLWILGHSIGQILHMKILNTESEAEHRRMTNRMTAWNFAGTVVFLIVLLLIPAGFWEWLFSKEFSEIRSLFPWLAPGILCFSISNILNHYFHARNRFMLIVWCNVAGLLMGLALCLLLIPTFYLKGACMAWSAGLAVSMLIYVGVYLSKKTT